MVETLNDNVWGLILKQCAGDTNDDVARCARVNKRFRRLVRVHFDRHGTLSVLGRRVDASRLVHQWPSLATSIRVLQLDRLVLSRHIVLTQCVQLQRVELHCITHASRPVRLTLPAHGWLEGTIGCIAGHVCVVWAYHEATLHRRRTWRKRAGYVPEALTMEQYP